MARKTTHYNLEKPLEDEYYDIDIYGDNMDIIDRELKNVSDFSQQTKDELNQKIGSTGDSEGNQTTGTIFAKLNHLIINLVRHMGEWTSARASKLDKIDDMETIVNTRAPSNTALSKNIWTDARANKLDNLDTNINSRAPASTALSNTTWTAARASAIDTIHTNAANASGRAENARVAAVNAQNNTATNNTANKTGILSQKLSYIFSLLEHGTYGLSAMKNTINTIDTNTARGMVKQIQRGVAFIDPISVEDCFLHVNFSKTANMEKVFVSIGMPSERNTQWGLPNVKQGTAATAVLVDEWTIRIATTYNDGVPLYVPWQVVEYY